MMSRDMIMLLYVSSATFRSTISVIALGVRRIVSGLHGASIVRQRATYTSVSTAAVTALSWDCYIKASTPDRVGNRRPAR